MNNGNSSKQVLLSILGIAVLVIAVVGVSFAFFTYSQTGQNQQLVTGSIFFQFTDGGDQIALTDQFPISDDQGAGLTDDDDTKKVLSFKVTGWNSSGAGITYTIKAVTGDTMEAKTRLKDNEVKLLLKPTLDTDTLADNITNTYGTAKKVGEVDGALASGVTLATGKITKTSEDEKQEDAWELRMWISSDVTIGDGGAYTADAFKDKYYSLKLSISAVDTSAE